MRTPRGLGYVRELWTERDAIAERSDRAPSLIVPDAALSDLGALLNDKSAAPPTMGQLRTIPGFRRRSARRYESNWQAAMARAAQLSGKDLPPLRLPLSPV